MSYRSSSSERLGAARRFATASRTAWSARLDILRIEDAPFGDVLFAFGDLHAHMERVHRIASVGIGRELVGELVDLFWRADSMSSEVRR